MTATYTFDIFATLDGYGSYSSGGDWGGYWGKQGPEFLDRRLGLYGEEQRMVLGATTFRQFLEALGPGTGESDVSDPVNTQLRSLPTTVVSSSLEGPLDWPDATVVSGDAVDIVARLKAESAVPLRSHGSLSLNRSLMAAGLVDRVQLTLFPVISGQTGVEAHLQGRGRLRPRAAREPDARRQHPRAHLPADPARLSPFTQQRGLARTLRQQRGRHARCGPDPERCGPCPRMDHRLNQAVSGCP